jgi:hypothetical protein
VVCRIVKSPKSIQSGNAYLKIFCREYDLPFCLHHEPELLFTHRLRLGLVHSPRLPGDVNRFFRSRTGRHRCSPGRFLDHFYRYECHYPDGSLASRPTLTTYRSRISGPIVVAWPKRCPQWAKQLHIRLTGSRAVTNRHTSEAQSPAPGTNRFEIEWDILEGRERSWGWALGLSFLCSVVSFVSLLCVAAFLCVLFWLHNLVFK